MGGGARTTLLGGLAVAACPLLCIGLPVLAAAGVGAGLALAIGGAVLGAVALLALAVGGALLAIRRGRQTACCEPAVTMPGALNGSRSSGDSRSIEASRG
jgi:hypothetical protein